MNDRKRKVYIDYLKAIGIILVVLGHINFANADIKALIYAFHMPLFFFISGLTIKYGAKWQNISPRKFFSKKAVQLLIPYFVWGMIYCSFSWRHLFDLFYGSYQSIVLAGSLSSLWFLSTLFVSVSLMYVFGYFSKNFSKVKSVIFALAISVICFVLSINLPTLEYGYFFGFNAALLAIPFIFIGFFINQAYQKLSLKKKYLKISLATIFSMAVLIFTYSLNVENSGGYVLFSSARIGNPGLFLLTAIAGCMACFGLALLTEKVNPRLRILNFVGQNTLIIFIIHKPIIALCGDMVERLPYAIPSIVVLIATGLITLSVASIGAVIINKTVPILAGHSSTKISSK